MGRSSGTLGWRSEGSPLPAMFLPPLTHLAPLERVLLDRPRMCIAPSRSLAPPSCKHAVLPPSPVSYPAAGALLCLVLWLCLRELGPVAASALLTGWLGTALHFKHLLGTTYRNGRLPGPLLNLGSRATFLALLAWAGGLPCRPPHVLLLALYAYSYLDGSEWTGRRRCPGLLRWEWLGAAYEKLLGGLGGHKMVTLADGEPSGDEPAAGPMLGGRPLMLCMHPHGFFPMATLHNLGFERSGVKRALPAVYALPQWQSHGLAVAVASFCFYVPGLRDVFLAFGVVDASRPVLGAQLGRGASVALWPGGAAEAAYGGPNRADLVLLRRRGFLELALEHGASLLPVYTFGDEAWFRSVAPSWCPRLAALFQRATGVLFPSALPSPASWHGGVTVVGTPLRVERRGPGGYGQAEVDELQQRYLAALQDLYRKHRLAHGQRGDPEDITTVG